MGTTTSKIDNVNPHVKRKKSKRIRPKYDRLPPLPPGEDKDTFEYIVKRTGDWDIETLRLTSHCCPLNISNCLWFLRDKHEHLGTAGKTARLLCRCGINDFALPEISMLREKGKEIFSHGSDVEFAEFKDNSFRFKKRLGISNCDLTFDVDKEDAGRISNISADLGISKGKGMILCLLFGLTKSKDWLDEKYRKLAEEETKRFKDWLEEKLKE